MEEQKKRKKMKKDRDGEKKKTNEKDRELKEKEREIAEVRNFCHCIHACLSSKKKKVNFGF